MAELVQEVASRSYVPVDDSLINYGALTGNLEGPNNDKTFYITTGNILLYL